MSVEESDIDDQMTARRRGREIGGARVEIRDGRVTSVVNWVFTALGALGLMVGVGVYNKLSEMNDTLIRAVVKIDTQADQIKEIKTQLNDQQGDIEQLRAQVLSLEGKTLRGIQEMRRGN